jgi:hypothetical protein
MSVPFGRQTARSVGLVSGEQRGRSLMSIICTNLVLYWPHTALEDATGDGWAVMCSTDARFKHARRVGTHGRWRAAWATSATACWTGAGGIRSRRQATRSVVTVGAYGL